MERVPRQADPPALKVLAELSVLDRVEPVLLSDAFRGLVPAGGGGVRRGTRYGKEVVDHRPEDAQ